MWVPTIHRIHIGSAPDYAACTLRGLYAVPIGRPASDNCSSDFAKPPSLLSRSSVHHPLVGTGGRQGLVSPSKWCSRPLFGMAVSVHTGGYPSQHGATNLCGISKCLPR